MALCGCKNLEFWGIFWRLIYGGSLFKMTTIIFAFSLVFCASKGSDGLELVAAKHILEQEPLLIDNNMRDGNDALRPPKSKTKGRPRKKHLKSGKIGKKAN